MLKWTLRIGISLLVVLVVGLGAVWFYLNTIAETAIEKGGTRALGVDTTVDSVGVKPFSGNFAAGGLTVNNPEGWRHEHILRVNDMAVKVKMGTLLKRPVKVPTITIDGLRVNIEQKGGENNVRQLLERIRAQGEEKPEQQTEGKPVSVGVVIIRNIEANVQVLPIGGELSELNVKIPELRLEQPTEEGGVRVAELMRRIVPAVFAAVIRKGVDVGELPVDLAKDIAGGLGEVVGELGGGAAELLEQAGGGLGEVIGELGGGVGDAFEGVGEGLGGAVEGILGDQKQKQE
jgi:hypothetical protein